MKFWAAFAVCVIFGGARGQEEDDEFCICVDIERCADGFISDGPSIPRPRTTPTPPPFDGAGLIDARVKVPDADLQNRLKTCDGLQICCPVRGGDPNRETTPRPTLDAPPVPKVSKIQGCGARRFPSGTDDLGTRISGSDGISMETFYGEVPWMVRITLNGEFKCGGTLITEQAVLTAAHCISGAPLDAIILEVGEWDSSSNREPITPQKQPAADVVVHPEYIKDNLYYDVALVFVRSPFKKSQTVDVACTANNVNDVDGNACIAVGWGKTAVGGKFPLQPILRKVRLPLVESRTCESKMRTTILGNRFRLHDSFLCAGGTSNGDTCQGDGGGPLICPMRKESNRLAVVGVTAWGIGCGEGNPTAFASVPKVMPWINNQLRSGRKF